MNKIASLSVIASLALLAIPSNTAFAGELKSKSLRIHHQNAWTKTIAFRNDGSDRMLNPQPLPPGPPQEKLIAYKTNRALTTSFANRGNLASLNPQPLPPGPPQEKFKTIAFKTNGSDRMLNPQPLPPGPPSEKLNFVNRGAVALNPQPLPPGPPQEKLVNRISTVSFNAPLTTYRAR